VDGFSKEKRYATGGKLSRAEMGNFVNPKGANKRSVWKIATKPYKGAHFATFPEELPETCIKAGTKKGDVVLDIFAGSGTTLRVASKLGRKGIGIELNPEYVKILKKRCKIESMSLEVFV
jgi:site-specific DNA-methyltransferase (cytosine-N4-specific)